MPDNSNTVKITLQVSDDGTIKIVDQVKGKVQVLGDTTEQASAKGASGLDKLKAGWIELAAGATAGYFAIKKSVDMLSGLMSAAAEAEQIESRMAFQIGAVGIRYNEVKDTIDAFAQSTLRSTRFSGEAARQGLGQMMRYTNDLSGAMKNLRLAMDMSTQTGFDLQTSIRYIGMAMNGEIEMLGKMDPAFKNLNNLLDENATKSEKAAFGLDHLNKMFGGAALKDMDTYAGKWERIKNVLGEIKEKVGEKIIDMLTKPTVVAGQGWVFQSKPAIRAIEEIFASEEKLNEEQKKLALGLDRIAEASMRAASLRTMLNMKGVAEEAAEFRKELLITVQNTGALDDAFKTLGVTSQRSMAITADWALRALTIIEENFKKGKASVVDYVNALNAASGAMKKLVGEDVGDKLADLETDYQKRVKEISREDPDRQKRVQAIIDDYFKARKEIEKMKIPVYADIGPGQAEVARFKREAEAKGITLKVNVEQTGGGAGVNVWGIPISDFFSEGGAEGSANIGFFGIGSTRKPISEKIREIISEFGGLDRAMSGLEAEINVAELSAQYEKLDAKLKQVERIIPDMSAMASWAGGSPYVGGPIIQTVTDLIAEYTEQMKIITMKMDYERLKTYGGSYQAGTRYVPQSGLYMLHEGEGVTSKNVSSNITIINHISGADDPHKIADKLTRILKYRLNGELIDLLKK